MADNGGLIPFVGTWDAGTFYLRGSCVLRSGVLYQARSDRNDGRDPANGGPYWENMAAVIVTLTGSVDPTAAGGVPAAVGSTYQRTAVGLLTKTGAGVTDWELGAGGVTVLLTGDETSPGNFFRGPDDPADTPAYLAILAPGDKWSDTSLGAGSLMEKVRNSTDGWDYSRPVAIATGSADAFVGAGVQTVDGLADAQIAASASGTGWASANAQATAVDGFAFAGPIVAVTGTGTADASSSATAAAGAKVAKVLVTANATEAVIQLDTEKLGFYGTAAIARPELPATPDAQDIADVLVALGLVTQAA